MSGCGLVGAFPCLKIIRWHRDLFSVQQIPDVAVDQLDIQSLGGFKIVITEFIFWMQLEVKIIIVEIQLHESDPFFS